MLCFCHAIRIITEVRVSKYNIKPTPPICKCSYHMRCISNTSALHKREKNKRKKRKYSNKFWKKRIVSQFIAQLYKRCGVKMRIKRDNTWCNIVARKIKSWDKDILKTLSQHFTVYIISDNFRHYLKLVLWCVNMHITYTPECNCK